MNVLCTADVCPVILNSTCVFYTGNTLTYTGITTNDSMQTALQKIDAKFGDATIGYVFTNGLYQPVGGAPVGLGGNLIANTTIGGNFTLTFTGNLQATKHITTGGTASQFVKGDGTLDSTAYQAAGNYITALTGDVIANGPGSVNASLAVVNSNPGTYGSGSLIPVVTVDTKGRVTALTTTAINVPSGILSFVGDVYGSGTTGSATTLTLSNVNLNVYTNNTFLKFKVNSKGLVTGAAPITNLDIEAVLGYVPVPNTRTITINGTTQNLQANVVFTLPGGGSVTSVSATAGTGISVGVTNPTTTPNITITNTAPDQVVSIGAGSGISVTGTYPNFTVAATSSGSVTGVTASSPLASSGGSTPNITISQASASTDGYLSSTDWNTFNNKQVALSGTGFVKISGTTISYDNTTYYPYPTGTTAEYVRGDGSLATFPGLTGYIPYTGATTNVNLGEYGITAGYVGFDLTPTATPTGVGTMYWDPAYRTVNLIDGDGDTTLQIGQEERILVHNGTGSPLTDGQVVYVTGSTGNLPRVSLADASSESTSAATLGVITETIANGADGFVTVSGIVNGLNTLAFTEGDILWLSETAGQFTNVKPIAPAHLVLVGYVIKRAGGNGSILVKIQNTQELEESSDVLISAPKVDGQGLFLQTISGTQLWRNRTIADVLGYTPASAASVIVVPGSGTNSTVRCGVTNTASGDYSAALGGKNNLASCGYSFVGGGLNNTVTRTGGGALSSCSSIVGGMGNTVSSGYSFIGGGGGAGSFGNEVSGAISSIVGGRNNTISSTYSFIGGGANNTVSGNNSIVVGGSINTASGTSSTISGGYFNTASGNYSFIGGGTTNTASGYRSVIGGGVDNIASNSMSSVIGGRQNTASGCYSSVTGGKANTNAGNTASIVGGCSNSIICGATITCAPSNASILGQCYDGFYHVCFSGNMTGGIFISSTGTLCNTVLGIQNILSVYQSCYNSGSNLTCVRYSFSNPFNQGTNCNFSFVANFASDGSFIGGGCNNRVCRDPFEPNASYSTISGGCNNFNTAYAGTISGGYGNCITNSGYGYAEEPSRGKAPVIAGGHNNSIIGSCIPYVGSSSIWGGATGAMVIGGGKCNTASGYYGTISGGYGNCGFGAGFFMGGGVYNVICGASGYTNSIVSGSGNYIVGQQTSGNFIGDGYSNRICGKFAQNNGIVTGQSNRIVSVDCTQNLRVNTISGGYYNRISNSTGRPAIANFIGSGNYQFNQGNCIVGSTNSFIGTGSNNIISNADCSFIGTGLFNVLNTSYSSILGGTANCTTGAVTNVHIIGSGIVAGSVSNFTYVNNLCQTGGGISDCRTKNSICDTGFGLCEIIKLRPVSYCWNNDSTNSKKYGFIAQEVQEAIPSIVSYNEIEKVDKDGNRTILGEGDPVLQLDKEAIFASYVNAFKDLKAENDTLKAEVDDIKEILKRNNLL